MCPREMILAGYCVFLPYGTEGLGVREMLFVSLMSHCRVTRCRFLQEVYSYWKAMSFMADLAGGQPEERGGGEKPGPGPPHMR